MFKSGSGSFKGVPTSFHGGDLKLSATSTFIEGSKQASKLCFKAPGLEYLLMDEGETAVANLPEMTINQIISPEKSGNAIDEKVQEATQAAAKMVDKENAELEKMNKHDDVKQSGINQEVRIEEDEHEPQYEETEEPKPENDEMKTEEEHKSEMKEESELRTREEKEETEEMVELKSGKEEEELEAEEANSEPHSIGGEAAPKGGEWLNSEIKKAEMDVNGKELMESEKGTGGGEKMTGRRKDRKRKVVEVQEIEPVKKKKLVQKKEAELTTPVIVRPHRERKSVERLVATFEKVTVKEFQVEKGHGTPLKDIPNVAFKLSKKKSGDAFKLLHRILFGKLAKASQMKSHIAQFSGFVWHENEEKQRVKVKEKFDKFNKEKLCEFCEILDVPFTKTTTKKEDIVAKLMDFLEAPHPTTKVLLAEKEANKSKKRKQAAKGSVSSSGSKSSAKKKDADSSKSTHEKSAARAEDDSEEKEEEDDEEDDEDDNDEEEENDGGREKEEDSEGEEENEGEEDDNKVLEDSERGEKRKSDKETKKLKRNRKASSSSSLHKEKEAPPPPPQKAKMKESKASSKQLPPNQAKRAAAGKQKQADKNEEKETRPRVFSRRKKNNGVDVEKEDASAPSEDTTGKKNPRGKDKSMSKEKKPHPSDEALKKAICDILLKVDFNTTTFSDIVKELAGVFNTDLTSRKSSIKFMIQEELAKVADEEGEEDEDGESENEESSRGDEEVEEA